MTQLIKLYILFLQSLKFYCPKYTTPSSLPKKKKPSEVTKVARKIRRNDKEQKVKAIS